MLVAVRRPPVGEALPAAGLLVVAVLALGPRPLLLGLVWLAAVTPRLVAVDVAEHRLPDAVVLPGYPVVLGAVLLDGAVTSRGIGDAVLGGAGYGLLILLLHVGGGMGFGDVKLAPLLGALATAAVSGAAVLAVVLAFAAGAIGAIVVLVRRGLGARMPFGPPMLLGAWSAIVLLS